jgi:ferric-dicitrate binding protein FerR (iron transport regulator)
MQPSLLIFHAPISRRRRRARMRAVALAAIAAVAVSGVALQALERHQPAGAQMAANPAAFDYFPG